MQTEADSAGSAGPVAMPMTDGHLSSEAIAAYVDGALAIDARERLDAHLAACAECRAELVTVTDLVASAPSVSRRRRWPPLAVGALAAAALAFVLVPRARESRPSVAAERSGEGTKGAELQIVAPGPAGTLDPRHPAVAWRATESGSTYRVTLADTTGATRWSAATAETSLVVPDSVALMPGARYFLYVDAQRADGWSLASGPRAFVVGR